MIQFKNLSKTFGGKTLFSDTSFQVDYGQKVAIIGRNGSGKSTLLRIIEGKVEPDSGEMILPKGAKIGALPQHITFSKETVLQEISQNLPDYDTYKAEKILMGLGFSEDKFYVDPDTLSGGFRLRLALGKVLLSEPDILLLDEPTNYLDILSIRWLERFLKRWQGYLFFISHDKAFVNTICTHVMGIKRQKVKSYEGNLDKYKQLLSLEEKNYERTKEKLDKKKAHMQAFVQRFGAKATKAKQAQSRLKAIEKMGSLEKLQEEKSLDFSFSYEPFLGQKLLSCKGVSFSYDTGPCIIDNLSFELAPKDRLAIIGKNGRGKSTLMQVIAGFLQPKKGEVVPAEKAKIAYFGQKAFEKLDLQHSLLEEMEKSNPKASYEEIRKVCGLMLFESSDMNKKIEVLSGGEKSRVILAKILLSSSNLLLLDEPTHHLDVESIEALMKAIKHFPGAVVLVSHDEDVLKEFFSEKIIVFEKGYQEVFLGNYQEFLQKRGWKEEVEEKKKKEKKGKRVSEKSKIDRLEKKILQMEEEKAFLEEQIASCYQKGKQADEFIFQFKEKEKELNSLYEQLSDLI